MSVLLFGSTTANLAVTLDTDSVYGFAAIGYGPTTAVTNTVSASATGGIAPYSYSWARISGDSPYLVNFGTNTVCWSVTSSGSVMSESFWKCVVTDSVGTTVDSPSITVVLEISS